MIYRKTPKNLIVGKVKAHMAGDIWDEDSNHICDIRGWGRLQYFERGDELQDKMARFVADAINEKLDREPLTSELTSLSGKGSKCFCICGNEILQNPASKIYDAGSHVNIICSQCHAQTSWDLSAPVPLFLKDLTIK